MGVLDSYYFIFDMEAIQIKIHRILIKFALIISSILSYFLQLWNFMHTFRSVTVIVLYIMLESILTKVSNKDVLIRRLQRQISRFDDLVVSIFLKYFRTHF